jgi:hypothetical protein
VNPPAFCINIKIIKFQRIFTSSQVELEPHKNQKKSKKLTKILRSFYPHMLIDLNRNFKDKLGDSRKMLQSNKDYSNQVLVFIFLG